MGAHLTDEQSVYNQVAMHILHFGLAEGFSDRIAQDSGVDAEIVRSLMQQWESEGRLVKSRCCPDCDALYGFSDQEFPIRMLLDGQELEGGKVIDGALMAMLKGEWVELPMPSGHYVPSGLPHKGTSVTRAPTLPFDPHDVDVDDAQARMLEFRLYPDEFPGKEIKLTAEEQAEIAARVHAEYDEATRQIKDKRELRAAGFYRDGLGTIMFSRCNDTIRF